MSNHDKHVAVAQEKLHALIFKLINQHGTEATLEALATQFGVCGAAAVICGAIHPYEFLGKYGLRALSVCDSTCKESYITGVLQ